MSSPSAPQRRSSAAKWVTPLGAVAAAVGVVAVTVVPSLSAPNSSPPSAGSPTTAPTAVDDGIEIGDGAIVWSDEFNAERGSLADATHWQYQTGPGGWGNNELQTYLMSSGVHDGEGHFVITAKIDRSQPEGSLTRYTSSRMVATKAFDEGVFEARIRLPDGPGLLPAFWMLGANSVDVGYPAGGEIDIVEAPAGTTHTAHTIHALDPNDSGPESHGQITIDAAHAVPLSSDFHVFSLRKEAGMLTFYIDGEQVGSFERSAVADRVDWPFDQPFHMLFSLAIGGNWPGSPTAETPDESYLVIDWVRVRALD